MTWKWCLEDDKGNLLKGWQQVKGIWYYLNPNGTMATGWIKDTNGKWYYLNQDGSMKIGWLKYKDKWYYLGSNGAMYFNCTSTIDGKTYTFDANGAWIENAGLVSAAGIDFIKRHEGFRAKKYNDGGGTWTIGYGTINPAAVAKGTITEAEATQYLIAEAGQKAAAIKRNLDAKGVILNQHQFDALVDFSYNLGLGGLLGSSFYTRVCQGIRNATLKDDLVRWSKVGGVVWDGLYRRRVDEFNLFMYGNY